MNRKVQIEILRLLSESKPYQMPEAAITNQLLQRMRPQPLISEINTARRTLETNQKIIGVRTEDGNKFSITARGEADLIESETV